MQKMLLYSDVTFNDIQVLDNKPHPKFYSKDNLLCPLCHKKLLGHGWRTRTIIDSTNNSCLIWIHRLICPECRNTYTELPSWVHPLKLYILDVIVKLLKFRVSNKHKKSGSIISRYLQEQWYKGFCALCLLKGIIHDAKKQLELLYQHKAPAGQPYVDAIEDRAILIARYKDLRAIHHRLHLLWSPPPP